MPRHLTTYLHRYAMVGDWNYAMEMRASGEKMVSNGSANLVFEAGVLSFTSADIRLYIFGNMKLAGMSVEDILFLYPNLTVSDVKTAEIVTKAEQMLRRLR